MGATLREAWLWLLLAFILGLVVGYVLKKRAPHEHPTAGITSARIGELEAQLAECKASAAEPSAEATVAVAATAAAASGVATSSVAIPASRAASAAGASAKLVAPKAKKTSAAKMASAAKKTPAANAPAAKTTPPAANDPAANAPAGKAPAPTKTPSRKPVAKPAPLDLAAAKSTLGNTVKVDDLKLIEGIGPKIEGLFRADGIVTWRDLSRSNVERLQGILGTAGPRYSIHNPGLWPKQAGLLADGKWADFKALNDKLKGGR